MKTETRLRQEIFEQPSVLRRLLSTPPKPHKDGPVKKPLTESGEKKQGGRPDKRGRPAKGQ